jgi:hypothetical protein
MNFGRTFKNLEEVRAWRRAVPDAGVDAGYRRIGDQTPRTILHQSKGSEEEPQPQDEEETPPDD